MKKKKFQSAEHAKTWRELKAAEEALLLKHAPPLEKGAISKGVSVSNSAKHRLVANVAYDQRNTRDIPSLPDTRLGALRVGKQEQRYVGDLAEREAKAQEEIEVKKRRTAPVYNKGGAMYLTDDMVEDMKSGGLRRRN